MNPTIKPTILKLRLHLLSFCLLCLTGKTLCQGNGPTVVKVTEDRDVILPCSLSPKENIESKLFDWKKPAQNGDRLKEVFFYDAGVHYNNGRSGQSEHFKDRVSHFQAELKHGNASIIIRNTKLTDSGNYTCVFPHLDPRPTFTIELVVDCVLKDRTPEGKQGTCPKPHLKTLGPTKGGVLVQCEVQGASPKPKVEWKDSAGNKLPAEEPQVTDRGGSYDIILQTTVKKTDYYHCVVTQEEINHQTETKIYVYIPGFPIVAVVVTFFCTLLVVGVVLAVLVYKGCIPLKHNKGSATDKHKVSAVPLNSRSSDPET